MNPQKNHVFRLKTANLVHEDTQKCARPFYFDPAKSGWYTERWMDSTSPSMRRLARRLLAVEAASPSATAARVHEAVRVCDKLRVSLTRLAGADGFTSLLRRALALARAEVPSLHRITVQPDCSMAGLEALAAEESDGGVEAAGALIAHLLGLLVTFIGASLTVRLVGEAWPDALLEE